MVKFNSCLEGQGKDRLRQTAPDMDELGNIPMGLLGGKGAEVSHDKMFML